MNISKRIYDFFRDEIELSAAGSVTSSLLSSITVIPAASSNFTIEMDKNYLWAPENEITFLSAVQGNELSGYHHSNLFILPSQNGFVNFDDNISVFGKVTGGLLNKVKFEWFKTEIKASVVENDILTEFVETPELVYETVQRIDYIIEDTYPDLSSVVNMARTYTVVAKNEDQDIVAEACGNYWTSNFTYNSSTAYTNGSYSIVNLSGESYPCGYSIVKGFLTDDNVGLVIDDCLDSNGSSASPTSVNFANQSTIASY